MLRAGKPEMLYIKTRDSSRGYKRHVSCKKIDLLRTHRQDRLGNTQISAALGNIRGNI